MSGNHSNKQEFDSVSTNPLTPALATEATLDQIARGLSGASSDGTVALAIADTWYAVPSVIPASDYYLVISKENAAGTIRWSFNNGGVPSTTNGNKMENDDIIIYLNGGEVVYFGSSTAGDDVNWSCKIV